MPLGEIIFDFFDSLKSRTRAMPAWDYARKGEQGVDLVKVDILLQGEAVDAFSAIVHKDGASAYGNKMTTASGELIPRQQFEVPVQAAIGSRIIARENIRPSVRIVRPQAWRIITCKRKLLEKQKEGQEADEDHRAVDVPQEASSPRCPPTRARTSQRSDSSRTIGHNDAVNSAANHAVVLPALSGMATAPPADRMSAR